MIEPLVLGRRVFNDGGLTENMDDWSEFKKTFERRREYDEDRDNDMWIRGDMVCMVKKMDMATRMSINEQMMFNINKKELVNNLPFWI